MKQTLLLLLLTLAAAGYAQSSSDSMVSREIAMLQFIGGGSPLTASEKQQAATVVAMAMKTSPEKWKQVDANFQKQLAQFDQKNTPYNNAMREQDRYLYAFTDARSTSWPAEFAIEKKIIDTHDPVIASDAAHHRLVTEHMLRLLEEGGRWVARSYQMPQPGSDYDTVVRSNLTSQFPALEPLIADGFAHIESHEWYLSPYFDHLPEPKRTSFFHSTKQTTFHYTDQQQEEWQIVEAAGMMSTHAAQQAPQQSANGVHQMLSERLLQQQMGMKALQGAARSFSPACNVTVGSYSDRAANACYP